jgi:hypothetical protein
MLIRYCYFKINNYICIGKWNNEKPIVMGHVVASHMFFLCVLKNKSYFCCETHVRQTSR